MPSTKSSLTKRRVVITGIGTITPVGLNYSSFRKSLKEGVSGENIITAFDASNFPVQKAFEVKNFNAHHWGTHLLDPFIQYAVAAADEAFHTASFHPEGVDPYRIGISVSSSKGGVHTLDRFKERFLKHPSAILGARIYANSVPNFGAQWIARRWRIKGPAKCYVAACATGTVAVLQGARMIEDGVVDFCVAGASDASIVPLLLAGYKNMKALSVNGFRPFDKRRSGFMVGEGAGVLFLESLESAQERGVKIYAEILNGAYGSDSTHPIHFSPEENALSRTLESLLKKNNLSASDIDYVNLHGTGTVAGDIYETTQIKKAFGKHAAKIPMSSTKPMTGHMLGAAGAVEVAACLAAIDEGFIPPTIGLEQPDPACDLDYTPRNSKPASVKTAISISMGFGGHIATIALKKI